MEHQASVVVNSHIEADAGSAAIRPHQSYAVRLSVCARLASFSDVLELENVTTAFSHSPVEGSLGGCSHGDFVGGHRMADANEYPDEKAQALMYADAFAGMPGTMRASPKVSMDDGNHHKQVSIRHRTT